MNKHITDRVRRPETLKHLDGVINGTVAFIGTSGLDATIFGQISEGHQLVYRLTELFNEIPDLDYSEYNRITIARADESKPIKTGLNYIPHPNGTFQTIDQEYTYPEPTTPPVPANNAMLLWYDKANNFVKYMDVNYDQKVALGIINIAITHPYYLPLSNLTMPAHKEFFGKTSHLFRGLGPV